jgi:hypothetical protein
VWGLNIRRRTGEKVRVPLHRTNVHMCSSISVYPDYSHMVEMLNRRRNKTLRNKAGEGGARIGYSGS